MDTEEIRRIYVLRASIVEQTQGVAESKLQQGLWRMQAGATPIRYAIQIYVQDIKIRRNRRRR